MEHRVWAGRRPPSQTVAPPGHLLAWQARSATTTPPRSLGGPSGMRLLPLQHLGDPHHNPEPHVVYL